APPTAFEAPRTNPRQLLDTNSKEDSLWDAEARRRHAGKAAGRRPGLLRLARTVRDGHEAEFTAYRDKVIDTGLGPVTLTRARYPRAAGRHGFAPREAGLGVAGASMSPGLTAMNDQAAAAGPFAKAARLLECLAGCG